MNKHTELEALLKRVKGYVMTKEEKEAQRRSWFVGEIRMLHPEMTREEAIERYKIAVEGI